MLENHSHNSCDDDSEECRNADCLPADQRTADSHQDGITQLNSTDLFTGFLLHVESNDFSDEEERNADADKSDQTIGQTDEFARKERIRYCKQQNKSEQPQIHLQEVIVDETDANQNGKEQAAEYGMPTEIHYSKGHDVNNAVERFDDGITSRNLRAAVVAFSLQKEPAEYRNQIPDTDLSAAGRAVRGAFNQRFISRQSENDNIQKTANANTIEKNDRVEH